MYDKTADIFVCKDFVGYVQELDGLHRKRGGQ